MGRECNSRPISKLTGRLFCGILFLGGLDENHTDAHCAWRGSAVYLAYPPWTLCVLRAELKGADSLSQIVSDRED
jgi:hypothetical protein